MNYIVKNHNNDIAGKLDYINDINTFVDIDNISSTLKLYVYVIRLTGDTSRHTGSFPGSPSSWTTPSLIIGFEATQGGTQLMLCRQQKDLYIRYKNYTDSTWRDWREL